MPSPQLSVRVEGNYDVDINNNANYDMAQAELRMIGSGGLPQSLEVMSLDIGALCRRLRWLVGSWRGGACGGVSAGSSWRFVRRCRGGQITPR